MNRRSTTPAYSRRIVACLVLTAIVAACVSHSLPATAEPSEPNARISVINQQINQLSEQTNANSQKSNEAKRKLKQLEAERKKLLDQVATSATDLEVLTKEMALVSSQLETKRSSLGILVADQYVEYSTSPLEMLASSRSITEYLTRREYQKSAEQELSRSTNEVRSLGDMLASKQNEVKKRLIKQQESAAVLGKSIQDQSELLVATEGDGAHMTKMTAELARERQRLQTEQQREVQDLMQGAEQVTPGTIAQRPAVTPTPSVPTAPVVTQPSTPAITPSAPAPTPSAPAPAPVVAPPTAPVALPNGGYPAYLNNCYVDANALSYGIDPWGYGCRQCVSYTAWKVLQRTGSAPMYWGNAKQWPASAQRRGYTVSSTPRAGSVAVMTSGPYGHVAWVESVNANGTVNISQYNYWLPNKPNGGWGYYSEFTNVRPSTYQAYIYI